jgi:hypothetical protein
VLRVLEAEDDSDPIASREPIQVGDRIDPTESARFRHEELVPSSEPAKGHFSMVAGAGIDRGVKDLDAGISELPVVSVPEGLGSEMPGLEARPVHGQQAEHVDDQRIPDQCDRLLGDPLTSSGLKKMS